MAMAGFARMKVHFDTAGSLLGRAELEDMLEQAEAVERVVLDTEIFYDLCLQAFAALRDYGHAALVSRQQLRGLLAAADAGGLVDLPSTHLKVLVNQALWVAPSED